MRQRYVPAHHKRDLIHKLQSLTQGSKMVDEYYNEMDQAMIRSNIIKDEETTMSRFMNGLNQNIAHLVKLHNYNNIEEWWESNMTKLNNEFCDIFMMLFVFL